MFVSKGVLSIVKGAWGARTPHIRSLSQWPFLRARLLGKRYVSAQR